jgi:UDP-2,3-diacylglucosamine hydrolase
MPSDAVGGAHATIAGGPIGLICGGGSFPGAVAEAIVRRGRRPVMFAVQGWAEPSVVERYTHHWIALGQLGRFLRLARAENCREAIMIGTMLRPPLNRVRLDWSTIRLMPRILGFFRGGDDRLLSGVAKLLEEGGVRVVGVDEVAPEIMMPAGIVGRYQPSAGDRADIDLGLKVIAALGPFDIGQAAVVANGHVLALEAAEGTANVLARIADLRGMGRVTTPPGVGVLVKAPKPGQDRRFDLPAIGPQTIEGVARAGLAGVAVAANSTIVAEPALMTSIADSGKIFFVGVGESAAA